LKYQTVKVKQTPVEPRRSSSSNPLQHQLSIILSIEGAAAQNVAFQEVFSRDHHLIPTPSWLLT